MKEKHDPGAAPVRSGDLIELDITSLAFGGSGVAHAGRFAVFVPYGLPGQRVVARVGKRRSSYAEARIEKILVHSPDEVPAPCVHFGPCGGCFWQHLDYPRQLEAKATQVRDSLVRIGGIPDPAMCEPLGAVERFRYRNKMEFSFADDVWVDDPAAESRPESHFGCGLHARGRFDKVIPHRECHLVGPWAMDVLFAVREAARASGLPPYSPRNNSGFFRYLVLREGINTGEKMALLITFPVAPGSAEERGVSQVVAAALRARSDLTSVIHGVTASKASVAYCEEYAVVHGAGVIHERLLGHLFEIAPNTFFQTNTHQAERLFETALDLAMGDTAGGARTPASTGGPAIVYDLYCGVGALTLPLSERAGRVHGVEVIESSIAAARANAERNGRANITFVAADMKKALTPEGLVDEAGERVAGRPDLVMLDPPRDGMHPDAVRALAALAPPRIVYISCNPATLARDAGVLVPSGYRLDAVVPVDMFPQTAHVEVVARFQRM